MVKLTRKTFSRGFRMAALGCAVLSSALLFVPCAYGDEGGSTPEDILKQWYRLKSESADTGRVAELVREGDRIVEKLQELENLRRGVLGKDRQDYYQRVERLQERFNGLLLQLEMARLSTLPDTEIESMRQRYEDERQTLLKTIRATEDSIIVRGERFLDTYRMNLALKHYSSKKEMIVDFIYRLAEIFYRRAEETFYSTGEIGNFDPAVGYYQRIIDEFPASEYVDDALYNIAYVKNSSRSQDDKLQALVLYKTLIQHYPNTPFRPEAYWRVAEYHFSQSPPDIQGAIANYAELLNYTETNWYARALYKIGWCHFITSDYPSAVHFFTQTAEISRGDGGETEDILFASIMDEALEYISVCFAQDPSDWPDAGVKTARAYVSEDTVRRHTYGKKILEYLGDIYRDQVGKYDLAIEAYKAYLDLYPLDPQAPWIQEKVINCYAVNLRDYQRSYGERDRLFDAYHIGTEWHLANIDPELRKAADEMVEKYYFQNLNRSISHALDKGNVTQIKRAVQMSRDYLEVFSGSPNAYTVNYNLAVLLDQHLADDDGAYVEYLKTSKEYPDEKFRKLAAVNAAVIARRMIAAGGEKPLYELLDTELSEAEQKYVDAIENYLHFYPQGDEAELFLLNAGSVYFNHGLYENSREYYGRLLDEFPKGERRADAYRYLMNGYFSEGRFSDAERIAKEIQTSGFDAAEVAAARTRQAESIFMHAQELRKAGNYVAAAGEYCRVVEEIPEFSQGDKALFESGLAYQQAQAWKEANKIYLNLVAAYPESDLADKALYNVAYNQQVELDNPGIAALSYERLAREYPQSKLAEDALRCASVNYAKLEDWTGTIRVNNNFIALFPDAPDANVFLFENAGLYLKQGDERNANKIYAQFAGRFPGDPRAVRARWERGQYLKIQGRDTEALAEFQAGLDIHRSMIADAGEGEETYASRCLYELLQEELATYEAIQFIPPDVEAKKREKLAKREHLLNLCNELNSLAKDEMFEGLYAVGKIDEELSLTFTRQALPVQGSDGEKILEREGVNQDAIEIALRAMEAYSKAAEGIDEAAHILRVKETELEQRRAKLSSWLIAARKSDVETVGLADSTAVMTELDRSLEEVWTAGESARNWSRRSQEKLAELSLRNAELKYTAVQDFLNLPDVGDTEELAMLYRAGVLSELAAPRAQRVIALYMDACSAAENSGNGADWKDKVLKGIGQIFEAFDAEYRNLCERSLDLYAHNYHLYQDLLQQGEGATTADGLEAADIAERLVLYSDYSYEFAVNALSIKGNQIDALGEGPKIPLGFRSRLAASAIEEVLRLNDRYADLATEALESQAASEEHQAESVLWEDAVMTFEDCAYNFGGRREELLNLALDFNRVKGNDPVLAQRISWALVEVNREAYLSLLADYGTEHWIRSDSSFVVNTTFDPGWDQIGYTDDNWSTPRFTQPYKGDIESLLGSSTIWALMGPQGDAQDTLYIRKTFTIEGKPVVGDVWISVNSEYALLINGEFINAGEKDTGYSEVFRYDVSRMLDKGVNAIAILLVDHGSTAAAAALALRYKALSGRPGGDP